MSTLPKTPIISQEKIEYLRGRAIEALTSNGTYFNDPVEEVLLDVLASHERLRATAARCLKICREREDSHRQTVEHLSKHGLPTTFVTTSQREAGKCADEIEKELEP